MNLDLANADHLVAVLAFGGAVVVAVLSAASNWWLSKRFAARSTVLALETGFDTYLKEHGKEHDQVSDRFRSGEIRFAKIEERMKGLPTKEDITALRVEMARLGGAVDANTENNKAVAAAVDRLVTFHMKPAS